VFVRRLGGGLAPHTLALAHSGAHFPLLKRSRSLFFPLDFVFVSVSLQGGSSPRIAPVSGTTDVVLKKIGCRLGGGAGSVRFASTGHSTSR